MGAPATAGPAASAPAVEAIAGRDRFATAVAVSASAFPTGAPAVVVATGRGWADALGGAALGGALGGPVLLSEPGHLPGAVAAEIARLGARDAYVLGGDRALSSAVASQVAAALVPGGGVTRLAGATSYETAEAVASATVGAMGPRADGWAFVATGARFADAVACSAAAARTGRPVFLVPPGALPTRTADALRATGTTSAVIVGGIAAVGDEVERGLVDVLGGPLRVVRVAGQDRYATGLELARWSAAVGLGWGRPTLVSGERYPDALVAGTLQARRGCVLLLTPRAAIHPLVERELWARRAQVSSLAVVGGTSAVSAGTRAGAVHALLAPPFETANAMAHVRYLAGLGPRAAGGTAERTACDYVAARLRDHGYAVSVQTVAIPGGRTSRNVIATRAGASPEVVVLGAHIDSKHPSPGGNDNASGVGVVLELARVVAQAAPQATVRFIAFGAEEISGATPDDHHFGSRHYVASLSAAERSRVAAAVSVDMVGYGTVFHVRSMLVGPTTAVGSLQRWAGVSGQPMTFLRDPGAYGWSDHEAFEFAGIPAAWVQWRPDSAYHTTGDTAAHVQPARVGATGGFLRGWLLDLDAAALDALR